VTVVVPAGKADVVRLALPPARLTVPSVVVPVVNVTVPTGTTVGDLTVAVNFTFCPATDGFGEDVTVVVVAAMLTTWLTAVDGMRPSKHRIDGRGRFC
jgi:hypothetical protein